MSLVKFVEPRNEPELLLIYCHAAKEQHDGVIAGKSQKEETDHDTSDDCKVEWLYRAGHVTRLDKESGCGSPWKGNQGLGKWTGNSRRFTYSLLSITLVTVNLFAIHPPKEALLQHPKKVSLNLQWLK